MVHVAESLAGGLATYINELIRYQYDAYDEIVVICPDDQKQLIENDRVKAVTFTRTGRNISSSLELWKKIRATMKASKVDILHLHSSFAGLSGRLGIFPGSTKIVYCSHGWSHAMKISSLKKFVYSSAERALSYNTDMIINISKSEEILSEEVSSNRSKFVTIYNGIHDEPWAPIAEGRKLGNLLFVGRYDVQKGVDILFDAMRTLGPAGFALKTVGGAVVGHPLTVLPPASVTDLGWRRPDEIRTLMAEADAVVMPSRWEGFGLVAAEAMRAGRPVIATRVGALPELVIDGETGVLCDPESPEALAAAVKRLAGMDIREAGIAARKRYEALFMAEKMFGEIDGVYRRLTGAR